MGGYHPERPVGFTARPTLEGRWTIARSIDNEAWDAVAQFDGTYGAAMRRCANLDLAETGGVHQPIGVFRVLVHRNGGHGQAATAASQIIGTALQAAARCAELNERAERGIVYGYEIAAPWTGEEEASS